MKRSLLFACFTFIYANANVSAISGLQLIVEPQDVVVEQGAQARLDCVAESSLGKPIIQWRMNDCQPISFIGDSYRSQLPNGSLYISSVSVSNPELTGAYQCLATIDNVGAIVSRTATIKIASLPGFEIEPQDTMVYPDQVAYFSCALPLSASHLTIQWLKDEHPLALDESRMTILPSGALEIDNVQSQDFSSYRCNASGLGQHRLSNKAQLALLSSDIDQGPTAPVFIAKPSQQVAIEGSTVTLECAANGHPKPIILWFKNDIALDFASLDSRYRRVAASSLVITDIKEEDDGSYQCRAENIVETLDAVAEVTVQVPPRFIKKPEDKVANESQDLELECEIYGKPEPKVTWLKNGEQIPLSAYYQLVNGYNLRINGLLPIDAVIFQCIGINPAGSVQASARLIINQPNETETLEAIEGSVPSAPRDLSPVIVSTRFVTLRWREPENTNGDIQNYYVYYKQEDSPREWVTNSLPNRLKRVISGLQPSVKYQFRIVAYNARGAGASSNVLHIRTQSETDVPGPPRMLQGHATSSISVALTWEEPLITNGRVIRYIIAYVEGEGEGKFRDTTATTYEIFDLTPFTEYNFWVQAVNENGPGASTSEITVRTLSAQPSQPPHNVTLEAVNSRSIIIRWEPPLEGENGVITGYKIRYRRMDKRHWSSITTQGNQRMYQLNGLEKDVVYQFRMCALNVNGTGPWSDIEDIELYERDLDESKVPNTPTNLKTKAMSDSILVSWSPPEDRSVKIRGYTLGWGKGLPDNHTLKLDRKQRYYAIESLEPLSEYVIVLRATNRVGDGPPAFVTVRTMERIVPESVSPLTPPVGLKAIVLSASTMVLDWTDSTLSKSQHVTDKRYYVVRYTSYHRSSNPRYKYYNVTDSSCIIDHLKPNTQYEFTVKLVKGRRESPWSMVVLSQTQGAQPSSPPRDLTVQSADDHPTAVMLHWQPPKQPNGPIIGYVVLYTTDNTKWDRDWRVEGVIGDQTEIMIKVLQPSTTYYFKIQARNSKGYGPFSSTVSFTTPQNEPLAERNIDKESIDHGQSNATLSVTLSNIGSSHSLEDVTEFHDVDETTRVHTPTRAKSLPMEENNTPATIHLDEQTKNLLGEDLASSNKKELILHPDLVSRWKTWLSNGVPKETRDMTLEKYPRQGNLLLEAPRLNDEIVFMLNEAGRKRDSLFVMEQNLAGSALAAVGEAITMILKDDEEPIDRLSLLEKLADAGKMLSHLHFQISSARKAYIAPTLSKQVKDLLQKTKPGTFLYGEKLSDSIKTAKSTEKLGKEIRRQNTTASTSGVGKKVTSRPAMGPRHV